MKMTPATSHRRAFAALPPGLQSHALGKRMHGVAPRHAGTSFPPAWRGASTCPASGGERTDSQVAGRQRMP
jgi:hypothetical protein